MNKLESRIKQIEEILFPKPSKPIRITIKTKCIGAKPGEISGEVIEIISYTEKCTGQIKTETIRHPVIRVEEKTAWKSSIENGD